MPLQGASTILVSQQLIELGHHASGSIRVMPLLARYVAHKSF